MSVDWIEKKIKSLFDEDLYEVLQEEQAVLAGGCLTSLFTGAEINDLDIYLKDQKSVVNILEAFLGDFTVRIIGRTKKSILIKHGDTLIQLITNDYYTSVDEIFDNFDFYINMCAYVFSTEKLVLHDDFLINLASRNLAVNHNTLYPIITALRVDKYKERGYTISKKDFIKIMVCVNKLEFKTWEEFKDHISGLYGNMLNEVIEAEEGEFSFERAIEILDGVESTFQTNKFMSMDIEHFLSIYELENVWSGDYVFKYVTIDNMSLYNYGYSESINYSVGNKVNGGDSGIYCFFLPEKSDLYYHSVKARKLVVLKRLDKGEAIKYDVKYGCGQVVGDWEVVKEFSYEDGKAWLETDEASKMLKKDTK